MPIGQGVLGQLGQCPRLAAAKPAAIKTIGFPGACKFVGLTGLGKAAGAGFAGKGMCLGLGLGLGAWGPLVLVGGGLIGGYFLWKGNHSVKTKDDDIER